MTKPPSAIQQRLHDAALKLFAERGSADVTVAELSRVAGVARGTVYNNLAMPEDLFEQIATQLTGEMNARIAVSYTGTDDPAERLSIAIRQYVRRSHDEPYWARFLIRFGFSNASMIGLWDGPAMQDVELGVRTGRFDLDVAEIPSAIGLLAGGTLSAILLVAEGEKTWRDAGSETARMMLRSLGLDREDALAISNQELPRLP